MEERDRTTFLGGTDVAAIMGLSRFRDALDVWAEKTGRAEAKRDNSLMEWGRRLEPVVAQAFSERTGLALEKGGFVHHPEKPFLGASPDYLIVGDQPGVLECKTSSNYLLWPKDMSPSGVDPAYLAQLVWYGGMTGMHDQLWIAALINGSDFRIYPVKWDPDYYGLMEELATDFWNDHVLADVPPKGSEASWLSVSSGARSEDIEEGSPEDAALLEEYALLKASESGASDRLKEARARIMERIGLGRGIRAGGYVAYVSGGREVVEYDWKAICLELNAPAEIVEKHAKKKTTALSLRVVEAD